MSAPESNWFSGLLPGFIGSIGAMLWIKTTWPRRIAMVLLGVAASYYIGPHVTANINIGAETAGFLVGLFAMTIIDIAFNLLDKDTVIAFIKSWFSRGIK